VDMSKPIYYVMVKQMVTNDGCFAYAISLNQFSLTATWHALADLVCII